MLGGMTARDLIEFELNGVGRQIEACLAGMDEAAMDTKCSPVGMTPREMIEHLGEAYQAFVTTSRGEKHEWGSYRVADKSTENLKRVVFGLRAEAVAIAAERDDEKSLHAAYEYIVGHDNYHVGQLVLARLQVEPDWDSYSIYA